MLSQPPPLVQALLREAAAVNQVPEDRDLGLRAALNVLTHANETTSLESVVAMIQEITGTNNQATAFAIALVGPILVGLQKGDLHLPSWHQSGD